MNIVDFEFLFYCFNCRCFKHK